jgi:PAS domain S-box-containing protein
MPTRTRAQLLRQVEALRKRVGELECAQANHELVVGALEQSLTANARDLAQLRRIEEELRQSEQGCRDIIEQASDIICIIASDGTVISLNRAFEDITGWSIGECIGEQVKSIVHPDDVSALLEGIRYGLTGEAFLAVEARLRSKSGDHIRTEIRGTPHIVNGKTVGICCIARDITERARTEQMFREYADIIAVQNRDLLGIRHELAEMNSMLEQKVAERTAEVERLIAQKDEFVARLGHDLKSPLTPLLALLPMMIEAEHENHKREMLEALLANALFIRNLVTKTLRLAKLNTAASDSNVEPLDVGEVVRTALEARKAMAAQRGINMYTDIGEGIVVTADRLGLDEVVDNLIVNAIYFTLDGGMIEVHAERKDRFLEVSVNDNGIGMTEEQLSHAFDEFYKADPSRTDLGCSGLGLAICRRIVETSGGRIWAESAGLGRGSSFHFTVRQAETDTKPEEATVEAT